MSGDRTSPKFEVSASRRRRWRREQKLAILACRGRRPGRAGVGGGPVACAAYQPAVPLAARVDEAPTLCIGVAGEGLIVGFWI
jgi:hypothetical protein